MIDTSVMVAALVADHEFHELARPYLDRETPVAAIVLAETYAQLRRTFRQSAHTAQMLLEHWYMFESHIVPTDATSAREAFRRAGALDLGGNIHDAIIAAVCVKNDAELVTLDRRQHAVALAIGAKSRLLLEDIA